VADKVGKVTSSFKEASKHQARDLDAVLGEMTLLQARVEMYLRFGDASTEWSKSMCSGDLGRVHSSEAILHI